ncbi:MAG: Fic family protein [Alphaproteobacteria bacterium]
MASYLWTPITDLPPDSDHLASTELASLIPIWKTQSKKLENTGAYIQFRDRLRRSWAIETGIIEHLYSIDRGITEALIEYGIEAALMPYGTTDRPPDEIVSILRDHEVILEGIFDFVARRRELSTSYIKEMHHAFTRSQDFTDALDQFGNMQRIPLSKGDWKRLPNNPKRPNGDVHEYCPPVHTALEMDRLVAMHLQHSKANVPTEVEAAWLHHRFTQIHPFQDGNGRVARALASLIFMRDGWFPLVVDRDLRTLYIVALEKADAGDLTSLVGLFSDIAKQSFVRALSISDIVLQEQEPIRQIAQAAAATLDSRDRERYKQQLAVFDKASRLIEIVESAMEKASQELRAQLGDRVRFEIERSRDATDHYFHQQIVNVARQREYFADTKTYRTWCRLKIREARQCDIIVSLHSLGYEFSGIVAASAFAQFREPYYTENVNIEGPYPLSDQIYHVSYLESETSFVPRFRAWLREVLVAGLDIWRKQL